MKLLAVIAKKKKKRRDADAAAQPAAEPAPTKKKKKPRWRDQRALTLVVTQLSYEADADAVAEALSVDGRRPTVRLVTDQAASANNRKHAGLAYAVYDTAGDAVAAASKTYSVNGRAVQIKPLDADHDDSGRRTEAAKEKKVDADAQAVDQYIVEKGLDGVLDAGVKKALQKAGYRVACRVCRDVAKALSTGDVENPSAYALGVLRNAAADAPAYRLTAAHVDSLIDQSVAAAPDKLGRADVDQRCRSYMREFSEGEVVDALGKCVKRMGRPGIGSASVYLMGLLKHAKEKPSASGKGRGKGKGRGRGRGRGKGRGRGRPGRFFLPA